MKEKSHPPGPGKPHQRKSAQRIKTFWVCFGRKDGGLCPGSYKYKRPGTGLGHPNINLVIMCCGQGPPGFLVPHPYPVVGGRSTRHGDAQFSQLSSQGGEVRKGQSMVCKHTVSHPEDHLSKMGQVSSRMPSSL